MNEVDDWAMFQNAFFPEPEDKNGMSIFLLGPIIMFVPVVSLVIAWIVISRLVPSPTICNAPAPAPAPTFAFTEEKRMRGLRRKRQVCSGREREGILYKLLLPYPTL